MKQIENQIQLGYIRKAQKKLRNMPELIVIGITGSYGKTSTKFALANILSERFSVCYTPGSFNTPMGICKVINNDLNPAHQVLILEMGHVMMGISGNFVKSQNRIWRFLQTSEWPIWRLLVRRM